MAETAGADAPTTKRRRRRRLTPKPTTDETSSTTAATETKDAVPPPPEVDEPVDALFQPPESQKAPAGSTGLPPVPDMKSGFQTIIKDLFADGYDVEDEFKKIVSGLSVDGALTPAALKAAANNTEEMADRAYRLYVVTKFETDAYVRETDGIIGAMRDRATAELEKEKRTMVRDSEQKMKPQRSKQITDADVAAKAAQMFPDEWTSVDKRKQQAKLMTAYTEQLSSLHQSRCSTVRRLLPRDDS